MISEQIYHKYGPEEYTELWRYMTESEVIEFTKNVCCHCKEIGGGWGRYITHKSCSYFSNHGKTRRCSPFACIEVGYFKPRKRMSGKDAYLDAISDYVNTWVEKMRERKRIYEKNEE